MHLDFIPLFDERYDLVIPEPDYEGDLLRPMLEMIHSKDYRTSVQGLPGYDSQHTGEMLPL